MEGFAPLGFFGEEEDAETDLFPDVEETTGGDTASTAAPSLLSMLLKSEEAEGSSSFPAPFSAQTRQELLNAAASFVRSRIAASESLLFALLLFKANAQPPTAPAAAGATAEESRSGLCFPGMSFALPLQEVQVATVEKLRLLAAMDLAAFNAAFEAPSVNPPLSDLFWQVSATLSKAVGMRGSKKTRCQRRVFLFTGEAHPFEGASAASAVQEEKRAAVQRARDLQADGVELRLFPLEREGSASFDESLFWREALGNSTDAEDPFHLLLADVQSSLRRLEKPPRLLGALPLHLTPQLQLPVCLYTCVSPPKLLRPLPIEAHSGEQLLSGVDFRAEDSAKHYPHSAEPPDPRDIARVFEFAGECLEFSDAEMREMKDFGSPGMFLLGFQPLQSVGVELNTSHALFLAPATHALRERARRRQDWERRVAAVTASNDPSAGGGEEAPPREERDAGAYYDEAARLFCALVVAMEQKQVAAVVRFVSRQNHSPAIAALTPQLHEVDERGKTLQSVGMHVIRLPFKEDRRQLEVPWAELRLSRAFRARCLPDESRDEEGETQSLSSATEEALFASVEQAVQILASEDAETAAALRRRPRLDLLDSLALVSVNGVSEMEIEDFDVSQIHNDVRARQMAAVEAFALRLSEPPATVDTLQPNTELIEALSPQIQAWKKQVDCLALEGTSAKGAGLRRGLSPSAEERQPRVRKKSVKEDASAAVDGARLRELAEEGRLSALTVQQLKEALSHFQEKTSGKKADLVERLNKCVSEAGGLASAEKNRSSPSPL